MTFELDHYTKFLSHDTILKIAKETKFMTRNIGINPISFLEILLNPNINVAAQSLSTLTLELSKLNINVTKQSVFEKLNQPCADFLKELLELLIFKTQKNSQVFKLNGVSENIPKVIIADSSSITLNPMHKKAYPGVSIKLQAVLKMLLAIDPRTLSINSIELTEGKKSDQKLNEHLFNFEDRTLVLKDLGFTSISDQEKIEVCNGKYISRVKLTTNFYALATPKFTKTGELIKSSRFEKIDIPEIYANLKEDEVIDTNYYFKSKGNYYSRRVIITRVPDEKLNERQKSTESKTRTPEHEVTPKTTAMNPFNIYITNLNKEEVSKDKIHGIYARRWDIELIFKRLKGTYDLDKVKVRARIERILIQIYSKMILFALECLYTQDLIKVFPEIEASPAKISSFLKTYLGDFSRIKTKISICSSFLGNYLKKEPKKDIKKSRKKL